MKLTQVVLVLALAIFAKSDVSREGTIWKERHANRSSVFRKSRFGFTEFHRHEDMEEFMKDLASEHPDLVKVETIGTSTEGRPIQSVHVSKGQNGAKSSPRPVIMVVAGLHGQEWLGPASAFYLLNELVENPNSDQLLMLDKVDWLIIPMSNPDGYEYTHTTDRFWGKTRSLDKNSLCYGTDLNRNFGYEWRPSDDNEGPCSDDHPGLKPFSEPETRALRDVMLEANVRLYLHIGSYGQSVLYPWGYTQYQPDNHNELNDLGREAASAMWTYAGNRYAVESLAEGLQMAGGGSEDFALAIGKSPLSYRLLLPAGGSQGFDAPPDMILPACKESMEAYRVMAEKVAQLYG